MDLEEAEARIIKLEQAVADIGLAVQELRALLVISPVDPLEQSFRAFKERSGARRESAMRVPR